MALAALASDSPHGRLWATIIQHRFGGNGALAGHPIGNLLLAGLNEVLADPVAALDELGRILGVKGRVLPMCPIALQIEADVAGLDVRSADEPGDPRAGGDRHHAGQGAPGAAAAGQSAGHPAGGRRDHGAPIWWCSGRVRGSPASSRTCWCPELAAALQRDRGAARAGAESGGRAGGDRRLLRRASPARAGSACARTSPCTTSSSTRPRVPGERERDQLRRTAAILDAEVEFADVSRPGTPLHDPARLAAALDGVRVPGIVPAAPTVPTPVPAASTGPSLDRPRGDDPWR